MYLVLVLSPSSGVYTKLTDLTVCDVKCETEIKESPGIETGFRRLKCTVNSSFIFYLENVFVNFFVNEYCIIELQNGVSGNVFQILL